MKLFTFTMLRQTVLLAAVVILTTLPISTPCQQLSLPHAPPPLMLAQSDNSWMTPEEREKLGIKEEPQPKPQLKPNPQPQQETRKSDDDKEYSDYEHNEYGTMVPRTRKSSYYTSTEFVGREFIHYKARNAVLWGIVFPGGGNFSIGRPGWGTLHFSIQALPLLISYLGYYFAMKDFEDAEKKYSTSLVDPKKNEYASIPESPTTLYMWLSWLVVVADKIWDVYGSYEYALEPYK